MKTNSEIVWQAYREFTALVPRLEHDVIKPNAMTECATMVLGLLRLADHTGKSLKVAIAERIDAYTETQFLRELDKEP